MAKRIPAEIFSVGEHIADELAARKWSAVDLAARTGLSVAEIKQIVSGNRGLLARDAVAIGCAFGTGPELWMRLQRAAKQVKGE